MTTSSLYVLTKYYNDYRQYGAYFVAAWHVLPTVKDLESLGLEPHRIEKLLELSGDEIRFNSEDQWFSLDEVKQGTDCHGDGGY